MCSTGYITMKQTIKYLISGKISLLLISSMTIIIFISLFSRTLEATNQTEFCVSCHSMRTNYDQFQDTIHFKNIHGVSIGCPDCHVPKKLLPKLKAKVLAVRDVYHEIAGTIDTPEKFEKRKWKLANIVWDKMKANDSQACRNCHAFERMDMEEQDPTGRKKHQHAMENGGTCIDCHQGIAHELPDEPDDIPL